MSNVEVKFEPPIAYITFNDPDSLNAFTNDGESAVFVSFFPAH